MTELSDEQKRDFEAAAFRRLVEHLRARGDVQNIDLMNLAGFCRNCLSRWYREEAGKQGIEIADPAGALAWAERLAPIVDAIDRRPDIHRVKMFGSRTGPV